MSLCITAAGAAAGAVEEPLTSSPPCPRTACAHLPSPPHACAPSAPRYDTRKDVTFAKDAPVIGLVLQRSHLVGWLWAGRAGGGAAWGHDALACRCRQPAQLLHSSSPAQQPSAAAQLLHKLPHQHACLTLPHPWMSALQCAPQVTGDHGHYDGVVAELEARGAKVVPVFAGAPSSSALLGFPACACLRVWLLRPPASTAAGQQPDQRHCAEG